MAIPEKEWVPLSKAKWKKHDWIKKGQGGFVFELIVKDETNRKIDRFLWNSSQRFREILELLRIKYGLDY